MLSFQTRKWVKTVHDAVLTFLRMTLFPLNISVGEISAGANCDFQTGSAGVVVQIKLQLSRHADALKEAAVCADAAVAALKR